MSSADVKCHTSVTFCHLAFATAEDLNWVLSLNISTIFYTEGYPYNNNATQFLENSAMNSFQGETIDP